MTRVVVSADASRFVRREAAYLRARSPRASQRFTQSFKLARRRLADFPEIGSTQAIAEFPTLRRMVIGDYIIDYLLGDPIQIIGIRHGRQEPPDWEGTRALLDDD